MNMILCFILDLFVKTISNRLFENFVYLKCNSAHPMSEKNNGRGKKHKLNYLFRQISDFSQRRSQSDWHFKDHICTLNALSTKYMRDADASMTMYWKGSVCVTIESSVVVGVSRKQLRCERIWKRRQMLHKAPRTILTLFNALSGLSGKQIAQKNSLCTKRCLWKRWSAKNDTFITITNSQTFHIEKWDEQNADIFPFDFCLCLC